MKSFAKILLKCARNWSKVPGAPCHMKGIILFLCSPFSSGWNL
jgi:hypothetical protein